MDRRWAAAAGRTMPWEAPEFHRQLGCRPPGTTRRPPSELRLPVRRAQRTPQQSSHFCLNVDDDFRFTQFFAEVLILATQLLVFFVQGLRLDWGPRFCGVKACRIPAARSCRHVTRCEEYKPSRRSRAPMPPDSSLALSASARTRCLYSAVKMRRLALATTSGLGRPAPPWSAPTPGGSASLRSASLRSAARAEEYVFVFFMLNFLPALLRN